MAKEETIQQYRLRRVAEIQASRKPNYIGHRLDKAAAVIRASAASFEELARAFSRVNEAVRTRNR